MDPFSFGWVIWWDLRKISPFFHSHLQNLFFPNPNFRNISSKSHLSFFFPQSFHISILIHPKSQNPTFTSSSPSISTKKSGKIDSLLWETHWHASQRRIQLGMDWFQGARGFQSPKGCQRRSFSIDKLWLWPCSSTSFHRGLRAPCQEGLEVPPAPGDTLPPFLSPFPTANNRLIQTFTLALYYCLISIFWCYLFFCILLLVCVDCFVDFIDGFAMQVMVIRVI